MFLLQGREESLTPASGVAEGLHCLTPVVFMAVVSVAPPTSPLPAPTLGPCSQTSSFLRKSCHCLPRPVSWRGAWECLVSGDEGFFPFCFWEGKEGYASWSCTPSTPSRREQGARVLVTADMGIRHAQAPRQPSSRPGEAGVGDSHLGLGGLTPQQASHVCMCEACMEGEMDHELSCASSIHAGQAVGGAEERYGPVISLAHPHGPTPAGTQLATGGSSGCLSNHGIAHCFVYYGR